MNKIIDLIMMEPNVEAILEEARLALAEEQQARIEFREWLTPSIKAEFIRGEIVLHSPAKEGHLLVSSTLAKIFSFYAGEYEMGVIRTEKALVALGRDDFEPDLCFWPKAISDTFKKDTMIYPAPEMVVEILSKSTQKRDRGIKFESYQAHGVREYWIVDPVAETIEQYINVRGEDANKFELVAEYGASEELKCVVFPGFSIPHTAIFDEAVCHQFVRSLYRS